MFFLYIDCVIVPAGAVCCALPGPGGPWGDQSPRTLRVLGSGYGVKGSPSALAPCARGERLKYDGRRGTAGSGPHGTKLGSQRNVPSAEREGQRPNKEALTQQPRARNAPGTPEHPTSAPRRRRSGAASHPAVPLQTKGSLNKYRTIPLFFSRKCP